MEKKTYLNILPVDNICKQNILKKNILYENDISTKIYLKKKNLYTYVTFTASMQKWM